MKPLLTIYTFATTPHRLYAASILRVGLALITVLLYTMHLQQRVFMWGVNGQTDWNYYVADAHPGPITLYALSSNPVWAEFLFWAGLVVSVAYMVGIFPRATGLLFFCLTASLYDRNQMALDGGQNLLILLALYLCFANTGSHLCLSRDWAISRSARLKCAWVETPAIILHNCAMFLVAGQICMLYYWSGFYKISGHKWQDGTAIYYVLRNAEFSWPPFSQMIYTNGVLVSFLTLSTLILQGAFPVLMWIRRAKPFLFVSAFFFHLGIAMFMGLVIFSATMVVADLAIFSDSFYLGIFRAIAKWLRSFAQVRPQEGAV